MPPRHKQKARRFFLWHPQEIASRRTVGLVMTEAAELGRVLNNLWQWAGRQDGAWQSWVKVSGRGAILPVHTAMCFPSLSFCQLYSTIFLITIFRKRTEKNPSGIVLPSLPITPTQLPKGHGVERTCQLVHPFFPSSMHWNDDERRKRPCKSPGDQTHITFCAVLPVTRIPQVCKREICKAWSWVQEWNKLLSCRGNW